MATMEGTAQGGLVGRWVNLVIGIWLFISAFAWEHTAAQRTNTWILGVLCVIFAIAAMRNAAVRWLNTALAVWLFISVWALPHDNAGTAWNNVIVAIVVFFVSLIPGSGERAMVERRAPA